MEVGGRMQDVIRVLSHYVYIYIHMCIHVYIHVQYIVIYIYIMHIVIYIQQFPDFPEGCLPQVGAIASIFMGGVAFLSSDHSETSLRWQRSRGAKDWSRLGQFHLRGYPTKWKAADHEGK